SLADRRRSAISPYATLFRSSWPAGLRWRGDRDRGRGTVPDRGGGGARRRPTPAVQPGPGAGPPVVGGRRGRHRARRDPAAGGPGDRKSTRLNSSHVKISYAV